MKLNIVRLSETKYEVQGQEVTKEYAEGAMLAGLFAVCGRNVDRMADVCDQYEAAGLSPKAFPVEYRKVGFLRAEIAAEAEKRRKDTEFHRERARQMNEANDPLAIARKRAEREAKEAKIRAHGQAIRAARSGNGRALMGWDENDTWI
ncbi:MULTISPECIES: hypothetical protein [Pseudomonas]|uniref:hypothetical protein n=1 Tax=Pseudomonas TaxID=286 RepID=UPI0014744523|nr:MULTISPECIES: hypothetical protein [Pseudomonas]MCU0209151.1 hypothetical protein [Pseudomonas shahriarae]NMY19012.1 hypothetical protein [Pseudomonas sp. WS 5410]